ncbi:MAG: shikimate dehydrogenase [Verrucomicrobiota bacterium]
MSEADPMPITAATRYCAVYGHPVHHSASPAMQNAGMAALGLDWRYLAFDVHPDDLRQAIAGAKAMKFIGLNLTVPHKLLALEMVDVLAATANQWGAVNTIRFEAKTRSGEWVPLAQLAADEIMQVRSQGFNTDADALVQAIQEDLDLALKGARVLLLGAGGAGRVAALRLAAEGVRELFLVNRTVSKAEEIASEIKQLFRTVGVSVGHPPDAVDLILNATSLGLQASDTSPLDETKFPFKQARAVYDMIYRPAETRLLKAAKTEGCRTANGLSMLLYQGAKALEIWSGKPAPLEIMRAALAKNVYGK